MTDYVVSHIWHNPMPEGPAYLRIVPGTVPHIDIAFYAADLITTETGMASAVYVLDADTAQLTLVDRPATRTLPDSELPKLRVLPPSTPGDPPDLLTAPTEGQIGAGFVGGPGIAVQAEQEETNPTPGN